MTLEEPIPATPGSCALRLTQLSRLSSRTKKTLVHSIATDISDAFILIAHHAEAGHLTSKHTGPINDVIEIIKETEISQRRRLEESVRKYRRQVRKIRREKMMVEGERECMRREFGRMVKRTEETLEAWKERARAFEGIAEGMGNVQREFEILRARGLAGEREREREKEELRVASPMEVDGERADSGA